MRRADRALSSGPARRPCRPPTARRSRSAAGRPGGEEGRRSCVEASRPGQYNPSVTSAMPTYDYRCLDCHKRLSLVQTYAEYGNTPVVCPHCGSANVKRLISRVRVLRSEDSRLDSLADPADWGDVDENDPRAIAPAVPPRGDEM